MDDTIPLDDENGFEDGVEDPVERPPGICINCLKINWMYLIISYLL